MTVTEQIAWNKSSSLPKIKFKKTQTLKLFTKIIKAQTNVIKMPSWKA
jgi:hypothetical protein